MDQLKRDKMIILDVAMPDSCLDRPFRDGIYCIAADNADGREIKKRGLRELGVVF